MKKIINLPVFSLSYLPHNSSTGLLAFECPGHLHVINLLKYKRFTTPAIHALKVLKQWLDFRTHYYFYYAIDCRGGEVYYYTDFDNGYQAHKTTSREAQAGWWSRRYNRITKDEYLQGDSTSLKLIAMMDND